MQTATLLLQGRAVEDFSNSALLFYLLAAAIYLFYSLWEKKALHFAGLTLLILGALLNTGAIIARWLQVGYPPFTSMYESMLFFGWCIAVVYLGFEFTVRIRKAGWGVLLLAALAIAYASLKAKSEITPLIPALRSNWLTVHVVSYFIGYGAMATSFVTSLLYLTRPRKLNQTEALASASTSGELTRKAVAFGFPFLTVGLITGAVWAKTVWGEYWSWDPKETWSLITWLVYLNFLHLRYTIPSILKSPGTKRQSVLLAENVFALFGFASLCFTYLGVNYLLKGLHSYAK
jgi:cytochrome c-type biogenesis protein CcsB